MSAVRRILDRLQKVRQTAPDRWIAACPAHDDRSPSLSIRDADGRVLLNDFGGCETSAVLAALGLKLSDLFDKPLTVTNLPPSHSRIPAHELLELVGFELDVAGIILMEVVDGRSICELAWERLALAAQRIRRARTHAGTRPVAQP